MCRLSTLETLRLDYLGLRNVPDDIKNLTQLRILDLSHNPQLEGVSGEMGLLKDLQTMSLKGCVSLKTPPMEIVSKGFGATMGYLRRLQQGSVACKRTKLMMVGLGGAGKTSLVRALTENAYGGTGNENITDGIDIKNWTVSTADGEQLVYMVWDFAGQTVYYNTHQVID